MAATPKPKMAPKRLIDKTKNMSIKEKAAFLKEHKEKASDTIFSRTSRVHGNVGHARC